jgi:hypothetical protein
VHDEISTTWSRPMSPATEARRSRCHQPCRGTHGSRRSVRRGPHPDRRDPAATSTPPGAVQSNGLRTSAVIGCLPLAGTGENAPPTVPVAPVAGMCMTPRWLVADPMTERWQRCRDAGRPCNQR